MEAKITAQAKQMADQDNAYNLMVQSYDERVVRLKNQIQLERDEKMELLGEVNALQDQLEKQRIERENDPTTTQLRSETAQMKIQLAKTRAELDNVKGQLLNREVQDHNDQIDRDNESNAIRRVQENNRVEFIGTPKPFQEVIAILELVDKDRLKGQEILTALEEIIVF